MEEEFREGKLRSYPAVQAFPRGSADISAVMRCKNHQLTASPLPRINLVQT
jgi:hypothetical protein